MTEDMRVVNEPRTYGIRSSHSYVQDVVRLTLDSADAGASQRMALYGRELAYEIEQRSREGCRAERVLRAQYRVDDTGKHEKAFQAALNELRNFTTGGGTTVSGSGGGGAAFVSPAFMWDQWAPYRGITRSFADACLNLPLPPFGMEVYVPYFSSTTGVTQQTEGQAVAETDPSTGFQSSSAVQTISGQLTTTLQFHDRGYVGGGADVLLGKQLLEQLDEKVDVYALNQALATAAPVAGQSSFSMQNLWKDLAAGREVLADTAGTRLRATHLFTTTDLYGYFSWQSSTTGMPFAQPSYAPRNYVNYQGSDDHDDLHDVPAWSRFTGTVLPGGVEWYTNDNVPNNGTTAQTQLIVAAPNDAVILLEDDPVLQAFPQSASAGSLEITLVLREYAAAVVRHASGVAAITGAGYLASLK